MSWQQAECTIGKRSGETLLGATLIFFLSEAGACASHDMLYGKRVY